MSRIKTKYIGDNVVTDAKLRQGGAASLIGRSANSTGNVADISSSADGQVLQRASGALSFALLVNANIDSAAAIAFSKLATLISGNILVGSAGNVAASVAMSGEATIIASGAVTLSNAAVIAKVLTGYASGTGTISATDSILSAIQKLNGNQALYLLLTGGTMSGSINMGGNQITNGADPTTATAFATKQYVDNALAAFQPKESAYAASTVNIVGTYLNGVSGVGATFTVTATGAFTIDGTTPPVNSRILLKNQTSAFQNGLYDLTIAGTTGVSPVLTRSLDYNTAADINAGDLIPVVNGTVNTITSWLQTSTVTTVGTDSLVFTQYSANPASAPTFYRAGQQAILQTYTFTVTSANATVGATYTNNSQTFTVINTIAAGTTLVCNGTGAPAASGTLTKATGTGDATITFSSSTNALPTSQVINFSSTLGTTNYAPGIVWKNITDANPQFQPFEITQKFNTGYVVTWNAPVNSLNYVLEYTAFPNV